MTWATDGAHISIPAAYAATGEPSLNRNKQIGGVQTQIYQYEVHSSAINATYTFWLGADGRFYKLESESERFKTSTVMEFDSSIKVTAP